MKFRNYCIVVMGDTNNVREEIEKVSEMKPNVLDAKGILIATFSSVVEPSELKDFFKLNRRSFLLFDLDPKTSGVHITKKDIHEGLFGFLKILNDDELKNKTKNLIREITLSSDTKPTFNKKITLRDTPIKNKKITEADIDKMGKEDKVKLLHSLIDKGYEKLTEDDKKILKKLAL